MQRHPRRVVLASASPRRRALLETAALAVEVRVPDVDESWPKGSVEHASVAIAQRKLAAIGPFTGIGLAADTVVVAAGLKLGKPADRADALRMLRALSGREHQVVTGFCVRRGRAERTGAVTTHVTFRPLSRRELEHYVATAEPYDKAGAYAVQGVAAGFVDEIRGSYTNVIGLPLVEVLAAVEALA